MLLLVLPLNKLVFAHECKIIIFYFFVFLCRSFVIICNGCERMTLRDGLLSHHRLNFNLMQTMRTFFFFFFLNLFIVYFKVLIGTYLKCIWCINAFHIELKNNELYFQMHMRYFGMVVNQWIKDTVSI